MKIAFAKFRTSLSRFLWPTGLGKLPLANMLLYKVTPEREQIVEFGRSLYGQFDNINSSVCFSHSGGAMLEVFIAGRSFTLEYWPDQGYGVDPDAEPFAVGAKYHFGKFEEAAECLMRLLREATVTATHDGHL